jgi:glycosyltransferase involved in cell wall biosynthesis
MKILVNLIPIKKGGGQQVASNFVLHLLKHPDVTPIFLVTENTFTHKLLKELKAERIYITKSTFTGRYIFQKFSLKKIIEKEKPDIIYTMFGPGLFYKGLISVTGCAYPNLFFPELDFWAGYSFLKRIQLKLIDKYRLSATLKSDFIIFENEAMMHRCHTLFHYPAEKTKLILASISEYSKLLITDEFKERLKIINSSHYNILLLASWHKNKNIEMIPFILKELFKKDITDVTFVISVPADDSNSIALKNKAAELGVEKNIVFFGQVNPNALPYLFEKVQAIILISLLESFSNNIIEAWHFDKPLFITDAAWSRAICKDSVIYVDRNNSENIAESIINFRNDKLMQQIISNNAKQILSQYPNPKQKVDLQIDYLKEILNG